MAERPYGLSERECEVLRLLARGHDVKSAAAALGLSVHTVSEHLREARLKTQATSSRGAARLLAEAEEAENPGYMKSGVDRDAAEPASSIPPQAGAAGGSRFRSRWGVVVMMSAILVAAMVTGIRSVSDGPAGAAAPTVASTVPAMDAIVEPGPISLSVTFDRPMRRQSYSFVRKSVETYPDCGTNQPEQSADGRTFTLRCELKPGRSYEVWFNSEPYMNFADEDGRPAIPFGLRFRTR